MKKQWRIVSKKTGEAEQVCETKAVAENLLKNCYNWPDDFIIEEYIPFESNEGSYARSEH